MLDMVIRNGRIVDGTGCLEYYGNIGIKGGRITVIGDFNEPAEMILDAKDHIVAPGFIDIHSHSDVCPFILGAEAKSKLYQGITLEITGNCGISCLPITDESRERLTNFFGTALQLPLDGSLQDDTLNDYAQHLEATLPYTNMGMLIGHGTLRGCVVGMEMGKANIEQIKSMCKILERELKKGAFGMSLGLIYPPSSYGDIDEFVALAQVLKEYEALLTVHMRSESTKIFEAVDEMLEVAKATGVHLEISHLKLIGKSQWGQADKLIQRIRKARAEGINVTCDQYPYTATSTGLSALVPKWAHDGGSGKMCERLTVPDERLLTEIEEEIERRGGPHAVMIVGDRGKHEEFEGKRLDEIAETLQLSPSLAVAKLLIDAGGGVDCCYFCLSEEDMLTIMQEPYIAVGSDGYAYTYDHSYMTTNPHPRSFGTFPRFFQTIREHNMMSIEKAVSKATGVTADILGLKDRGKLRPGYIADIVIFDEKAIRDKSTYIDSLEKPEGINAVILGGTLVLKDGEDAGIRKGEFVRHGR